MRKLYIAFTLLVLIGCTEGLFAQQQTVITVSGVVTDADSKEPLIGVNISVKDTPGMGVITDIDGKYEIKIPLYKTLVFSYIGFSTQEILVKDKMKTINIQMKPTSATTLDEVVVTGTGTQKKITLTGAVTTVDVNTIKTPASNISNALAGNVPGILARQRTGQPGWSQSEFWVRGISTFGANSGALVLVDGFERNLDELNTEDIESFSVLKDASATAIYGSRGANGVVLITTKRGKAGKVNINAKVETSYKTLTKVPEFVDGYTYANLLNESRTTRYMQPLYSERELYMIKNNLDPDLYPNVDWMDVLLRDGAMTYRANLDLSGGGSTARYFVSASYLNEEGMYKTDNKVKDYNTNATYERWNYRMNVDIDITRTTLLQVGLGGALERKNEPAFTGSAIWNSVINTNPIMIPVVYSDGKIPASGEDRANPWVYATQTGYKEWWNNNIQSSATLTQKLDFVTKGLKFYGRFGFDTYNNNNRTHKQWPEQYKADRQRNADGDIVFTRLANEQKMEHSGEGSGSRKEFFEAVLDYNRTFGSHMVGAVLKYTQDQSTHTGETQDYNWLDRKHQGLAGRATYGWKYRYFFDFNFGYNGSENFAPGHQFGFFPAYSAAWNIAEEPIVKKHLPWMNMLKVRYSYGKVGNDDLGVRFPFLETFREAMDYNWGDHYNDNKYNGLTYQRVASRGVTWEISTKHDVGVDFSFFGDKLTGTIDYFHEQRDGIYMERKNLPDIVGLYGDKPTANVGSVLSKGIDGNIAFRQKIGNVDINVRANLTYGKNKILVADESNTIYYYRKEAGYRVDQTKGYIALGLFKDYEDIRNHAQQNGVMPGDIKYKDINSDGVISEDDIVPIGATSRPNMVYGIGASAQWNGFDFNVHFQGAGKSTFCIEGSSVFPFKDGDWGNVFTDVVNNYWSLDNPNPNAKYPRLTWQNNANNNCPSTFWMRDGSYLRLKTLEIGYTLPKSVTRVIRMNNMRFFFIGQNLLTFSKFKLWDPEMGSTDGQGYPLNKSYTIGLSINM